MSKNSTDNQEQKVSKLREELGFIPSTVEHFELLNKAIEGEEGFSLVPASKADKSDTVEVYEPRVLYRGYVVCKAK